MADFLSEYCGEYGKGTCRCANRINYAIQNHRIDPSHQDYTAAEEIARKTMLDVKEAMEEIDDLAQHFSFARLYATSGADQTVYEKIPELNFSVCRKKRVT